MVLTVADVPRGAIEALLDRFGLELCVQATDEPITGSYWGDREAGGVQGVRGLDGTLGRRPDPVRVAPGQRRAIQGLDVAHHHVDRFGLFPAAKTAATRTLREPLSGAGIAG